MKRMLILSLMIGQVAWATMPRTISYQGVLRSSSGSPIPNGNHTLTMKLYNVSTGGTALWTETDTVFVTNCTFHTMLGDGTALNLAFDQTYWLGLTVDSGTEQTPRTEFTASPYAFRAAVADSVVGGGSGGDGDWIINGVDMYAGVSGKVGIGTSSPQARLEVRGAGEEVRASGATSQFPDRWVSMVYHPSIGPLLRGGSDYSRLTLDADEGAAGKIVLGCDGDKVGIGTIDPMCPLDVVGLLNTDGFQMTTGAGAGKVLTSNSAGVGTWQTASGGMGGTGSTNRIPKFSGTTTLTNSALYDNAGKIGLGITTPSAQFEVDASSARAGKFTSDLNCADDEVLYVKYTGSPYLTCTAVYGEAIPASGNGIGANFKGGLYGAIGYGSAGASSNYTWGLKGEVSSGAGEKYGVEGFAFGDGRNYGVIGNTSGDGICYGVYGTSPGTAGDYSAYFTQHAYVGGNFTVGGTKLFRIDHPFDPANKYLHHYCLESDEITNVYSGNVVLDANGEAWVELAEWFEAINRDPRYQLTCIGGFANVYVAEEIAGNRFKIAGGEAGMKISWQVTALRSDPAAEKYRLPVEAEKPEGERGKYLHPDLFGQPPEMGIGYLDPERDVSSK